MNPAAPDTQATSNAQLRIAGVRCAACVQLIEFRLSQLSAVKSFRIHPVTQKAHVVWDATHLSLKQIIQTIVDLGYAAFPSQLSLDAYQAREKKWALWRLFVAGFAMMQVMMYAFPAYLVPVPEVNGDLTPDLDRLLKVASLVITIPVILFSALPFFRSAWRDVRHRHLGMDVPVSVGILFSFFASCWATFFGGAVYFDSVIMFVFLLLGARFIEENVKRRTAAALSILSEIHPALALRLEAYPESHQTLEIAAQEVQVGDVLLVPAGQQVPCDAVVLEGESACDEALMTGESLPVRKLVGSTVMAGSINLNAALIVQAQQVGDATQLAGMIAMMESASLAKPRLVELADRHASRFLLAILLIAIAAGGVWAWLDASRAVWIAVSVIVVTCPCALSLATPGVMSGAIGQLAKFGTLVTKGSAIENMAQVTHIVLDKTGTLSFGQLKVLTVDFVGDSERDADTQLRGLSLALSAMSMHPVSKAIVEYLLSAEFMPERVALSEVQEVAGAGVSAKLGDHTYRLGNPDFVVRGQWQEPAHLSGKTLCLLGDETQVLAVFTLEDRLREDASAAVAQLQEQGYQLMVLSGDREAVVRRLCGECGISQFQAGLSPAQKYQFIADMQAQGKRVMMVGDGMNDGPALSLANVSIAMGQGAPISQTRSDALLMSNRLLDLSFAMRVARVSYRLIRQNLGWALLYNVLAVPAAVLGFLAPWHAALGMSVSSLIVVLNGLRVLRLQPAYFIDGGLNR